MNEREDVWPIMVRLLPAPSTIESWRPIVDQHLEVRAVIDKTRIATTQGPAGRHAVADLSGGAVSTEAGLPSPDDRSLASGAEGGGDGH